MVPGSKSFYRLTKPVLFLLCLLPLIILSMRAFDLVSPGLGANPIETLLHELGRWGLKFLLMSLAITPFRRWTGWVWLLRFRRMLGLFAFFYILLHFLCYAILDQSLDFDLIIEDVIKRPYITIGMTGLLLLIPLAITSTKGMMRRLGRRWQKLHRMVYVIGVLGVWHFYWQVKLDALDATIYALILTVLLVTRIYYWQKARQRSASQRSRSVGGCRR